jgi:hypothetical protein
MKNLKFIFLIICSINFNQLMAQEHFISNHLNEMFSKLPLNCKSKLNNSGRVVPCTLGDASVPIKIQYNIQGEVSHLGIKLFDFEDNLIYPSTFLAFVERLSLDFFLEKDLASIVKRNKENKVRIKLNEYELTTLNNTQLQKIKNILLESNLLTNVNHSEKLFFVRFQTKNEILELLIPANYELISGMDKEEYSRQIYQRLQASKTSAYTFDLPSIDGLKKHGENIYVSNKEDYFKNISGNTYYVLNEQKTLIPVKNPNFVFESIQNSFLIPISSAKIKLNVGHRLYGNQTLNYTVDLNDFIAYFQTDHNLFFGFEKNDNENIEATLIIEHNKLNYINLLYVSFKSSDFFSSGESYIDSKFYTVIPSDNIKNLFADIK